MEEFITRRANLSKQLRNNSIAIIPGAKTQIRNGDAEFPFRQNSDFYYLTGFSEPAAVLVLCKDANGVLDCIMFNLPNDPDAEIWNGKRAGQISIVQDFGANAAHSIANINTEMPGLMAEKEVIYYPLAIDPDFDKQIIIWLQTLKQKKQAQPETIINILPILHEMRLFKSALEIDYMRKAATISANGHRQLMQQCKAGMFEYQLEAIFNSYCLQNGCRGLAYNSIIASGNNSCTLHYVLNDQILKDGDLVLVDAGAEYNNYAADITRTFPVSGKFSPEQKQIYNLVLKAQLAGIEQIKPGNIWDSVQQAMLKVIVAGLVELEILIGNVDQLIKDQAYKKFYMHSSGHWLGLDVHDAGKYKQAGKLRSFEPGMVLTVEPGIYISKNLTDVANKWLGIGVRIEDDVLVTNTGNEVLSSLAPKTIEEIERVRV